MLPPHYAFVSDPKLLNKISIDKIGLEIDSKSCETSFKFGSYRSTWRFS